MGVKIAHALGAQVVVFTTSPNKKEDARRLGADEVVISRNADEMQKHAGSFDFILDAVAADHDINAFINLLRRDASPWNMNVQLPFVVMSISKGVEFGSASVPAVTCC